MILAQQLQILRQLIKVTADKWKSNQVNSQLGNSSTRIMETPDSLLSGDSIFAMKSLN